MSIFKRTILSLFLMTLSINAFGLSFMGATLGTSSTTFINILKNRGCRFVTRVNAPNNVNSYDYREEYIGDFWEIKNTNIIIYVKDEIVNCVLVGNDKRSESTASHLIMALDHKYGNHYLKKNRFYEPSLRQYFYSDEYYWYLSDGVIYVDWEISRSRLVLRYNLNSKDNDL